MSSATSTSTPAPSVEASPAPSARESTVPAAASAPAARTSVVVVPSTPTVQTNEQRWRAQQIEREPFTEPRIYLARRPTPLLWYDPLTGQSLVVGTLLGPFTAQASFTYRPAGAPALEVPYRINGDFGLTSISPVVQERMANAGYTDTVEAYVLLHDGIEGYTAP